MTKQEKQKPEHKEPNQTAQEPKDLTPPTAPPAKRQTVEIGRAEHEELLRKTAEFAELQDKLLRSAADFDNARKRLAKEREEFLKFAFEGAIYDLLPILDNFELALAHIEASDEKAKSIREGFLLIQKQLLAILTGRGLRRVKTVGTSFDPHQHEAVGHIVSEDKPEGIILEEVLAGYQLNGKLLRPAKVRISAKEEKVTEEKAEELT